MAVVEPAVTAMPANEVPVVLLMAMTALGLAVVFVPAVTSTVVVPSGTTTEYVFTDELKSVSRLLPPEGANVRFESRASVDKVVVLADTVAELIPAEFLSSE